MKQKIVNCIKHPLISGSIVLFSGSMIASVLNFLFNLFMSRNLSVADYGILASLVSIISLAMVISGSATPMIINFAASYFAKNDLAHVRGLFRKITIYYFFMGIVALLIFVVFPDRISTFFHLQHTPLLIVCGLSIFVIFLGTVNGALLNAKLSFRFISLSNLVTSLAKLVFGVAFFMLGWGVSGAMDAFLLSLIISYLITYFPLRFLFNNNLQAPKLNVKELFMYGTPAAIATFGVTLLISTDIILVKHFFSPDVAGIYAGLSLVGKVIFFLTAPIPMVMFPLISQKHAKKEDYNNTFFLSLAIVLLPSLAITVFYFLFPEFSINVFIKKKEYLQAANLLGYFGIFITLYSLLNVFTNFYLSIRKTNIWIPILIASLAQIAGIWFYHQSFMQIIIISLSITSALLIFFIWYYFNIRKQALSIETK